jgi:hypothetical protein
MVGILVAVLLAWLVRKGRIVARLASRSRQLLAGLAAVHSAQADEARQALLIRVGSSAIAFGLVGLLAMLALFAAVEAAPVLLHWGPAPHGAYLASLSIVLLLQALFGRARRQG